MIKKPDHQQGNQRLHFGLHPCRYQGTNPTVPANPTCFEAMACPSSFDDIAQPINTDRLVSGVWHVLDLAPGRGKFKTAMNSDEFHTGLDDGPDAFAAYQRAGWNAEPQVVPDLMVWPARAAANHAHHFSCPTCIAARCGACARRGSNRTTPPTGLACLLPRRSKNKSRPPNLAALSKPGNECRSMAPSYFSCLACQGLANGACQRVARVGF